MINGDHLRQLIIEQYGSYEKFGESCEPPVTRQYVYQVIHGQTTPSLPRAVSFAAMLNVSIDEILGKAPAPVELQYA